MSGRISKVYVAGLPRTPPEPHLPLIVASNHMSWFDGFLVREVQRRIRPRGLHRTIMLERELSRSRMLQALGGVGFDPDRPQTLRGVLRSLTEERSAAGGLFVTFFPQGRIVPSWRSELGFRPGLELLTRELAPCVLLPLAMHLEPGARLAPGAFLHGQEPISVPEGVGVELREVELRVADAGRRIRDHLALHGEDAGVRWPADDTARLP